LGIQDNNAPSNIINKQLFAAKLPQSFTPSELNNALSGIFSKAPGAQTNGTSSPLDKELANQHPLQILLAEDNRINQKVAVRILEKLGYTADVVENGRAAISALKKQPYDVILMDIQMPEMDGTEATNIIRSQWPPEQQPQIVAMTAHALEGDREHYLAQGMDYYISKPIQINKLIEILHNCAPVINPKPTA
jgi:CheY-like chemotaxis protein